MRILIIEDEKPAALKLERMLHRYNPEIGILGKIASVEKAVSWFKENESPDLVFLDIHLLDGTSFEILDHVRIDCPVIFTTAFDQYAQQAFQLHSVDYLLKPVSYQQLEQAMDKYQQMRETFGAPNQSEKLERLVSTLEQKDKSYKSRFLSRLGPRMYSVPVEEVAYLYSQDKMTFLITWEQKRYMIDQSLEGLESVLDPRQFFRVNRQLIVHIESIEVIHAYFKGRLKVDLKPPAEFEVIVSSRRVPAFREWLDQ